MHDDDIETIVFASISLLMNSLNCDDVMSMSYCAVVCCPDEVSAVNLIEYIVSAGLTVIVIGLFN